MAIVVYGIPNCDTVKKARAWLDARGVSYVFHDYKKAGISADKIAAWCDAAGWETVLNRAGTTFRKLPDARKASLDRANAIALMLEQPSMIKRPIVEADGKVHMGFKPDVWEHVFPG